MNEKDKRWAETIIDYCNRIDDYLNRLMMIMKFTCLIVYTKMLVLWLLFRWVNLPIGFSDEFREEYDDINWKQLIGLRNITAHNYENIVDDIFWEIMHEDVPEIKAYLEEILYG